MLDHEGDGDRATVVSLNSDLTIKVDQETRNDGIIDFEKTIEVDTRKQAIDIVGLRVGEIYYPSFMNISILDLSIETSNGRGSSRELRHFRNVVFGESNILGNGFRHFHLNTITKKNKK